MPARALLVIALSLACTIAQAADRLALVVGIDGYANLAAGAQLERPAADARAVGEALRAIGFRVTLLTEGATQEAVLRRFAAFADQVQPGDTALFYFAGHGLALQGTNYLLPADIPAIEPGQEMLARSRAIAETDLSAALRERGARVVVMVLDACRDNPFRTGGTRSVGQARGLARVEPVEGVFSLYAASAGQQALDRLPGPDPSANSVFTRVFVREVRRPELNLIDLGEGVRDEVARLAEAASHKQVPAYYNEVRGARFLSLARPEGSSAPAAIGEPPVPEAVRPRPTPPALVHRPPDVSVPPRPEPFSHPVGLDPAGDNWVALRSLPSGSQGSRLMKLGPDALFRVIGRQGAWVQVRLREGPVGWVRSDFVGCCRAAPGDGSR